MPETKEPNNCPKENCGKPESTHRWSAGKRLSICGNSHSWNQEEVAEQRAKAKDARRYEIKVEVGRCAPGQVMEMDRDN